jgi:hypothetical protein
MVPRRIAIDIIKDAVMVSFGFLPYSFKLFFIPCAVFDFGTASKTAVMASVLAMINANIDSKVMIPMILLLHMYHMYMG